jgi:predicted nucleic acid-binding Zn ribbon protein
MKRENEESLGSIIRRLIKVHGMEEKLREIKLKTWWAENMGSSINRHTQFLQLKQGHFYIHLSSPSLRQELSYQKESIRLKLNQLFAEESTEPVIQEIILR